MIHIVIGTHEIHPLRYVSYLDTGVVGSSGSKAAFFLNASKLFLSERIRSDTDDSQFSWDKAKLVDISPNRTIAKRKTVKRYILLCEFHTKILTLNDEKKLTT